LGHDATEVTAAVLAGGLGTRLRPVVPDRPKVLAEVGGRPFLAYLLDQLAAARVRQAVLCTGYGADQVEAAFGARYGPLRLSYSREPVALGTGGALRHALPLLAAHTVLAMNGDSYCHVDLDAFRHTHRVRHAEGSLVVVEVAETERYGRVRLNAEERVCGFEEKHARSGSGWVNAGIYLLERALLETIPAGSAVSLERDLFPAWTGRRFFGFAAAGPFLDIGTPQTYAQAECFFAGGT
jgi:NDP-sugar pyrophosphorylase family protein